MNSERDSILEKAIAAIRDEHIDSTAAEQAAERVWSRLRQETALPEAETIRDCAGYRALIPGLMAGKLSEARTLLLEDHTHECPACRRALAAARSGKVLEFQPTRSGPERSPRTTAWRLGLAAASVAALTLGGIWTVNRFTGAPGGPAIVQSADGALYRLTADSSTAVNPGAAIEERQTVRAAVAGAVLRLPDGSLVEMRERTELSMTHRRGGTTLRLERGSIIVQAAKQGSRRLEVATDDCRVTVKGTIFAVSRGVKGSRVAVIEGAVNVDHGGASQIIRAGEQVATSPALAPVAVEEEISWSRNRENYLVLLGELAKLRQRLEAAPGPGLRYSTRLLELVPAGTVIYAGIPNLGPTLVEARRLLEDQARQSPVLRQWWEERIKAAGGEAQFDQIFTRLRTFSEYLGSEIAVAVQPGAGHDMAPVVLAEVVKPGFRAFVEAEIAKIPAKPGEQPIRIIDNPAQLAGVSGKGLVVFLRSDLVALSPEPAALGRLGQGSFAKGAFGTRIAEAYRGGVTWVVAAELEAVLRRAKAQAKKPADDQILRFTGLDEARYFIGVRKETGGRTENRATLAFAGPRHGVAAWLAAPAPMRAVEYISPDATFAAAFLINSPALLVDELFKMIAAGRPNFEKELAAAELLAGVNVRQDLLRPLGGELALAMDGPVLPQPSWKVVVEVNDPARLQAALEKLLATVSQYAPKDAPRIDKIQAGGRTYYRLSGLKQASEVHYVYSGGYLLAAPSRALLDRALQSRDSGFSLTRSAKFTALLPRDPHANFSGMVYHALGDLVAPLAHGMRGLKGLTAEQHKALEGVAAGATPSLVLIYGENDRIALAGTGRLFGLNWEHLLAPRPSSRMRKR